MPDKMTPLAPELCEALDKMGYLVVPKSKVKALSIDAMIDEMLLYREYDASHMLDMTKREMFKSVSAAIVDAGFEVTEHKCADPWIGRKIQLKLNVFQ